jgi:hypothetical protein
LRYRQEVPTNIAVALPLLSMVTSIGGNVGQTISTALWTNTVERKIVGYLPLGMKHQSHAIYASLVTQLSFEWDNPQRQAIVRAYGEAQRLMVIVGTCALVPCILWVAMMKDYKLS